MNIGWIGTGVMGAPMAGHLMEAGHLLFVFNRTRAKAKPLLDGGAAWCESPREVSERSEVAFTMVGVPSDVRETYSGTEGIFTAENPCRITVDMTTSTPSLAVEVYEEGLRKGISCLDAPVSGGDIGAKQATLAIMAGGDGETFDEVIPLLQLLGKNISYMGTAGRGQHTKMCNQILVAGTMIAVCECLLYAEAMGLDQKAVIDIVGKGAASSWLINNLGPKIVDSNYAPGFYVEHFIKDMGIALREAEACGLSLPGLALVHQLYVAVKTLGHGRSGTQALMLALRALNNKKDA